MDDGFVDVTRNIGRPAPGDVAGHHRVKPAKINKRRLQRQNCLLRFIGGEGTGVESGS